MLKHELRGYFHSLVAYIYCAFMLIFIGIGAMLYNIQASVANFEYVLQFVSVGLVVIIPVLTMRILAEEKRQKTDQLLYSLPLSSTDIILGKYFALLIIYLIPMVIAAFYPLIFSRFGDVYLKTSYGALIGFILLGAALIAAGCFISSLTENQGFAAGIAIPLFLLNYFSVTLAEYISATSLGGAAAMLVLVFLAAFLAGHLTKSSAIRSCCAIGGWAVILAAYVINSSLFENLLPNLMKKLSLFNRFNAFVNGVFDLTNVVFYLTVIIFFLFLCVQSLEKRRYN